MPRDHRDLVVVGAGAAGLYCTLTAAQAGARVTLVSATPLAQAASYWAQGGLAAALAADDSPERHLADTVAAGRRTVRESAARVLCEEAPDCVRDLERLGVAFDADRFGRLALGLEGGHSVRRVAHAGGSATGRRVTRELSALVALDERVEVLEGHRGGALWVDEGRCVGIVCDDGRELGARAVVLATGGTAALWGRTTNPPGSIGGGLLLAHGAGAGLADLELMQFHPTAVTGLPGIEGFLVTEAIRGEGAQLFDGEGERFVDELAPRDEVARAIEARIAASGGRSVWLDMRTVDPAHFPNVVEALRTAGLEPQRELVPVAPAAHYLMGGIVADIDGRTEVDGLFAAGECACTGLHGANRLASNSLSECFVFGRRAATAALDVPPAPAPPATDPPAPLTLERPPREVRMELWRKAGIERREDELRSLLDSEHALMRMIAAAAIARRESRGAHWRVDAPERNPALDLHHAVVRGDDDLRFERWD